MARIIELPATENELLYKELSECIIGAAMTYLAISAIRGSLSPSKICSIM